MTYRTIQRHDSEFHFIDGVAIIPRAQLVLEPGTPSYVAMVIAEASNRGWLKIAANVPDVEYTWEKVQE
jgi:hypothetical protein